MRKLLSSRASGSIDGSQFVALDLIKKHRSNRLFNTVLSRLLPRILCAKLFKAGIPPYSCSIETTYASILTANRISQDTSRHQIRSHRLL